MEKSFQDMTNEELKGLIEDFELNVEAKNPSKPNKSEYIAALEGFKKQQDVINGNSAEGDDESPELSNGEKVIDASKLSTKERKKLQIADLFRKECVLISDNRKSQTPDKAMFVSWGNRLVGHHDDIVNLEGRHKQYVRRGALANLKAVTLNEPVQEDLESEMEWNTQERFTIVYAEGLTDEELRKKKIEQQIKAANSF